MGVSMGDKKYSVLLVDDEADILELMQEEFSYAGFDTHLADCGNKAVEVVQKLSVDVIISDYKMPNGNGMSVLAAVNKLNNSKRPIFYFVSGQADISIQEALDAGAKKFFSKPFDLDDLIQEVKRDLLDQESA